MILYIFNKIEKLWQIQKKSKFRIVSTEYLLHKQWNNLECLYDIGTGFAKQRRTETKKINKPLIKWFCTSYLQP